MSEITEVETDIDIRRPSKPMTRERLIEIIRITLNSQHYITFANNDDLVKALRMALYLHDAPIMLLGKESHSQFVERYKEWYRERPVDDDTRPASEGDGR